MTMSKVVKSIAVGVLCLTAELGVCGSLPDGYAPLEYLESDGTWFIDTGVCAGPTTVVTMDAQLLSTDANQRLFGADGQNDGVGLAFCVFSNYESKWASALKDDVGDWQAFGFKVDTQRHAFILDATSKQFSMDGAVRSTHNTSVTKDGGYTLYVFATHHGQAADHDEGAYNYAKMRLYSMQILQDGMRVRDFKPCVDSLGHRGLYDAVTRLFYDSRGAWETEGDDVFDLADYAPLEYVQSTKGGGQYVDTGVYFKHGDTVDLRFDLLSVNPDDFNATDNPPNSYSIFGARGGAWLPAVELVQNVNNADSSERALFFDYYKEMTVGRMFAYDPTPARYVARATASTREIFKDGVSFARERIAIPYFSVSGSAYIFAANVVDGSMTWLPHPQMRFRSLSVGAGKSVSAFLPAKRLSDGKVGVLNAVGRSFLTNLGGGEDFVAGPELVEAATRTLTVNVLGDGHVSVNGVVQPGNFTTNLPFGASIDLSAVGGFAGWTTEDLLLANPDDGTLTLNGLAAPVTLTANFMGSVARLDYIDSTPQAGQYIDTGFVNAYTDTVDLRFDILSTEEEDYWYAKNQPNTFTIFGVRPSSAILFEVCHNLKEADVGVFFDCNVRMNSTSPTVGSYVAQATKDKISIVNPAGQRVEASKKSFSGNTSSSYLFHSHLVNMPTLNWAPHPRMRFHSLTMAHQGEPEHRFVPAVRLSDNKPGVWDCYNRRLLVNKGLGDDDFALGPLSQFEVCAFGAGKVSYEGAAPVSHLVTTRLLKDISLVAVPESADDGLCVAWIGEPSDTVYAEDGFSVSFVPSDTPFVGVDVFMPSASVLHVAPGASESVDKLVGIASVHVGSCRNETAAATFRVTGAFELTAANGGYAIVTSDGGASVKQAAVVLMAGGKMKLLGDVSLRDVELPDAASTLDLNGHKLTIRTRTHADRSGWKGQVVDTVGGGSCEWLKPGLMLLVK